MRYVTLSAIGIAIQRRSSCRAYQSDCNLGTRAMYKFRRYLRILLLLCVASIILCTLLMVCNTVFGASLNKIPAFSVQQQSSTPSEVFVRSRNFSDEQMSQLGKWLWSPEGTPPPKKVGIGQEPYLILIWKHGTFLERRHIRHFTDKKFSPWDGCSVKNCLLSYDSTDLPKAAAVVFHLHLTKNVKELPQRTREDQRWVFLTDESPLHTFLHGQQDMSDYNDIFNWSMTYRTNSDVPVPYGRTILSSATKKVPTEGSTRYQDILMNEKTKLVAVMGSNCAGNNGRWDYVRELISTLGDELHIYGHCLNGNRTACPGHFTRDCAALNAYKFYLAFENSNCREYLTEKVFWHGYEKMAIPIIMGAPKKDCIRLLPPHSFLHVDDFANSFALASYIQYLNRHDDEYFGYHEWRRHYKVINEHGYFASVSKHYCRLCEALNYNSPAKKTYNDIKSFWSRERDCASHDTIVL